MCLSAGGLIRGGGAYMQVKKDKSDHRYDHRYHKTEQKFLLEKMKKMNRIIRLFTYQSKGHVK